MIVTGAFLAEAVAVVDNKMHVWGGVVDKFTRPRGLRPRASLVVLTQASNEEAPEFISVNFIGPNGSIGETNFQVPEVTKTGTNIGWFWYPIEIPADDDGHYVLVVAETLSVALDVTTDPE